MGFFGKDIVIDTILNGPRDMDLLDVEKANSL